MNKWYVMNTKNKLNLEEIMNWFNYDCTILVCNRFSDRGANDKVYIVGAFGSYGRVGERVDYITDTGRGYGGKGEMLIESTAFVIGKRIITKDANLNINEKRTVWVFK